MCFGNMQSIIDETKGRTMIDLDALQAAAEAATPGPWTADCCRAANMVYGPSESIGVDAVRADAEFIAAANPAVVLELIQQVNRASKEAERLGGVESQCMWAAYDRDVYKFELDKAIAGLARLVALHYEDEHVCAECSVEEIPEHGVRGVSVPWPCPTVRALTGEPSE